MLINDGEKGKRSATELRIDPFTDDHREKRHECDGHRQSIPRQRVVVRGEMVVSRADANQGDSDEEDRVRRIKRISFSKRAQNGDAHDQEREV